MGRSKIVYGGETLIDLTADTVTEATLLKGATAHNKAGEKITGTKEFKTQTKTIQSSRVDQSVTPDSNYDGLSKVTVNAIRHTRLQKTMGSSASQSYSIPLSEIGFTPRIYALVLYMSNISNGSQNQFVAIICDMQNLEDTGASTSGAVTGLSSSSYDLNTVGTSFKGAVSGSNFVFTASYGYFRPSGTYRFYFWG